MEGVNIENITWRSVSSDQGVDSGSAVSWLQTIIYLETTAGKHDNLDLVMSRLDKEHGLWQAEILDVSNSNKEHLYFENISNFNVAIFLGIWLW